MSRVSTGLIIGEKTFKLLQSAGPLIPVPGIGLAAQAALTILDIAQTVRKNKEDFVALGKESCLIMATIIERVQSQLGGQSPSEQADLVKLQQDAEQLFQQMKAIEDNVREYSKKSSSWLKRTLHHHGDKETIQRCKDGLRQALALFSLQSDIELRKQIAALARPSSELGLAPPLTQSPKSSISQNSQYLSPTFSYNIVGGNVSNTHSDDSFNVSGSGNNINFSFAQSNNNSNKT